MRAQLPLKLFSCILSAACAAGLIASVGGKTAGAPAVYAAYVQPNAAPQAAKAPQPAGPSETKKPEVNQQDAADKAKAAGAYEYNAKGKRDPFAALIVKPEAEKKKGLTPIENYDLMEFKLIAILWNKSGYYAAITLPDGKSYTVRVGTKLGLRGGKIYKITNNSVIIREQVRDQRGAVRPKDTILKLRRGEEG